MCCIRLYIMYFGLIWYIYILVTRQQLILMRCCSPALFRRLFLFNSTRGIRVAVINTVPSLHNSFSFSFLFFWARQRRMTDTVYFLFIYIFLIINGLIRDQTFFVQEFDRHMIEPFPSVCFSTCNIKLKLFLHLDKSFDVRLLLIW